MQIHSQNIHGGTQQFADTIVNQYQNASFGQNDIELLKFIGSVVNRRPIKRPPF